MTKKEFKEQILGFLAEHAILPSDIGKLVKSAALEDKAVQAAGNVFDFGLASSLLLPVLSFYGSKAIGNVAGNRTAQFFNPYPFDESELGHLSKQELLNEYLNQIGRIKERRAIAELNTKHTDAAKQKAYLKVRGG